MKDYEYFARFALENLARMGFKTGTSGVEPVDYYESYDHEIEWNKYFLRNGKVIAEKRKWRSSIIPKSWSAYIVATKQMKKSELEDFLSSQFELDKEEISLLIDFIGKSKDYVKRNIVQVDNEKVIIDDLTLARKNNKLVILLIKKFRLDSNVKRRITRICNALTSYGVRNVAVIPDSESLALDEIIKLPVIVNGFRYDMPFAIRSSSANILLIATGTISKRNLTKLLKQEYSLNSKLVRRILAFLESNAKIPFAGYLITIF